MSEQKYGKASYGKNTKYENSRPVTYKLKFDHKDPANRSLTLRFAPPVKDQQNNPHGWYKQINQHYGYGIEVKKKNGETVFVPQTFKCVRRYGSDGQISEECPECNEILKIKTDTAAKEAALKAAGRSEDEIKSLMKANNDWLKSHNLDRKIYLFAKNQDNVWGYAAITKTCKEALDAKINELVSQGLDPLDPEAGVWFRFTRVTPDGKVDTVDTEKVVSPDGRSFSYKTDTMTQNDWEQIEKLPSLSQYATVISTEDVRTLVDTKGEAAAAIFARGKPTYTKPTATTEQSPAPVAAPAVVQAPVVTQAAAPTQVSIPPGATLPGGQSVEEFLANLGIKA